MSRRNESPPGRRSKPASGLEQDHQDITRDSLRRATRRGELNVVGCAAQGYRLRTPRQLKRVHPKAQESSLSDDVQPAGSGDVVRARPGKRAGSPEKLRTWTFVTNHAQVLLVVAKEP